jgi:hypothetical protein
MSNIRVAVINASTTLTDAEVQAVVPALQVQVHNDFAPAWGIDADLSFVGTGGQPAPGAWWLAIMDNSDQQDALGYHETTNEGLPMGKVFAASDQQDGLSWTVTASHELLEMLADPEIDLTVSRNPTIPPDGFTLTRCAMRAKRISTATRSTARKCPTSCFPPFSNHLGNRERSSIDRVRSSRRSSCCRAVISGSSR